MSDSCVERGPRLTEWFLVGTVDSRHERGGDPTRRNIVACFDAGRRLASSLIALDSVGGVTFDAVRDGLVIETLRARELATALLEFQMRNVAA